MTVPEYGGPTLYELMVQLMDEVTAEVMEGDRSDKTIGQAIGVSKALALFTNPYNPKPKAIREAAKERWRNKEKEAQ